MFTDFTKKEMRNQNSHMDKRQDGGCKGREFDRGRKSRRERLKERKREEQRRLEAEGEVCKCSPTL
jgi:hypothetical protein